MLDLITLNDDERNETHVTVKKDKLMNLFCHANGFPPASYNELFSELKAPVDSLELAPLKRAFSKQDQKKNWHHFGDEFLADLEKMRHQKQTTSKIVGIGHSMGGVMLLRAACIRPELFERLILIDPTFLPEPFVWLSNYLPRFINRKIHPVGAKAYRRRDAWPSKEAAFESFRKKKLFRSISDQGLWDYVNAVMIKTDDGGITLGYSKAWRNIAFRLSISAVVKAQCAHLASLPPRAIRPSIIERWKKFLRKKNSRLNNQGT